ncbi:MAG: cyclic nucleotide-binding domain-containing protein [Alphaproteobacteria bacterium]|nr:cyclic nucleotide-binding domain-containing protein [Alphaproteobacteria bacterium]
MINIEQILLLRQLEFFNQVSDEALADLMSIAQEKTFKVREVIIDNEMPYAPLHIMLNGSIQVINAEGQEQIQAAPQIIGLRQVFNPKPTSIKVIAHTKATALLIDKDALYRAFVMHPSLAFVFLQELSKKG